MSRCTRKQIVGKIENRERDEREESYTLLAFKLHRASINGVKHTPEPDPDGHIPMDSCVYSGFKPTFPVAFTQKNSPPIAFPQEEKSIAFTSMTRE